jgi:hypothetical protein
MEQENRPLAAVAEKKPQHQSIDFIKIFQERKKSMAGAGNTPVRVVQASQIKQISKSKSQYKTSGAETEAPSKTSQVEAQYLKKRTTESPATASSKRTSSMHDIELIIQKKQD